MKVIIKYERTYIGFMGKKKKVLKTVNTILKKWEKLHLKSTTHTYDLQVKRLYRFHGWEKINLEEQYGRILTLTVDDYKGIKAEYVNYYKALYL